MQITTLGIDLAKFLFQLHGVDADGNAVLKKRLRRGADVTPFVHPGVTGIWIENCA